MPKMLITALTLGLALSQTALAKDALPPLEEVLTIRIEGDIVVDSTGRVVSHKIRTPLPASVQERLDKAVPQWTFEPVVPPAGASEVRSTLQILLSATEVANGYAIKVESVDFPDAAFDPAAGTMRATRMEQPKGSSYGAAGVVVVAAHLAPDASILEVVATRCSLRDAVGDAEIKAKACAELEKNTVRAVEQWEFEYGPGTDTASRDTTVSQSFTFVARGMQQLDDTPGVWRRESRTAYRQPSWERKKPVLQGESLASKNVLWLRDGVVGAAL